jgi:hypothetical protein
MAVDLSGIKTTFTKKDVRIKLPFRLQIVGPSGENALLTELFFGPICLCFLAGTGKTSLVLRLLRHREDVMTSGGRFSRVLYCHAGYSDLTYKFLAEARKYVPNLEEHMGLAKFATDSQCGPTLLIIGDIICRHSFFDQIHNRFSERR